MTATLTITITGSLADHPDLRNLEALTRAAGELLNNASGRISTRLAAPLLATDTQAVVESTYGFPDAGAIWVGGVGFTYTSRTDGAFDGLASVINIQLQNFDAGTEVACDLAALTPEDTEDPNVWVPQLELAFRDTIPGLATGSAIIKNKDLFGLPIVADDPQIRAGLQVACYAPRDRRQTIMQFLEGVLSDRATTITVDLNTSYQRSIVSTTAAFSADMVGRWVRLTGTTNGYADGLYEITEYADAYEVLLNSVGSVRYGLLPAAWAYTEQVTCVLQAWSLEEDPQVPCSLTVRIWAFDGTPTPGDYMQPATTWLLYTGALGTFTVGDTVTGLTSGFTGVIARVVEDGTDGAIQIQDLDGVPQDGEVLSATGVLAFASGTVGDQLVTYDGETGGGFAVGDTVTGATGGAISTVRGLFDGGSDGLLVVEYDVDASASAGATAAYYVDNEDLEVSASVRGTANGDSQTLERPDGQPEWGSITLDAATSGEDRRPLYLTDGTVDEELETCLGYMVAAGVWPRVMVGGYAS